MAVSIFKGVVPVEDWSETTKSVLNSFNRADENYREQQRYNEAQRQKREKEYLDLVNVPPEEMISNELQKMQGDKTQQFVELAGQEYRNSNYKPGLQSKIKMQQARNALVSWQNKIKSNEEQWKQAYSVIKKDKLKGDYDDVEFWNKTHNFYKSGELPEDLLMPKKYDSLEGYFVKAGKDLTGTKQEWSNSVDKNGKTTTNSITRVATEEERKAQMTDLIHEDIRLNATVVDQFSKLPYDEKKKYLDKYPEKDKGKAIKDFVWDKYNELYQKNIVKNSVKPTASPFKYASQQKVQLLSYDDSDKLPISLGEYPTGKSKRYNEETAGEEKTGYIQSEGGVAFAGESVTTIQPNEFYDLKHTELQKSKSGKEMKIKDIAIKYYPVDNNNRLIPSAINDKKMGKVYLDKDGNVKPGYKLKAMLVTSPDAKSGNAVPLTENLKQQLKTKYPQNSAQIDDIELEKTKGEPEEGVNTKEGSPQKEYKVTNQQLIERAKKEGMSPDKFKKEAEKMGYKIIITK